MSMAVQRNVHYSPLPTEEGDDDGDLRYKYTPKALERVPWRSIALALFLLLLGAVLLFLALFVFTGHMEGELSQGFGLLVVGILAFLPGMYHTLYLSFFLYTLNIHKALSHKHMLRTKLVRSSITV